jgi:hypothetical protein
LQKKLAKNDKKKRILRNSWKNNFWVLAVFGSISGVTENCTLFMDVLNCLP